MLNNYCVSDMFSLNMYGLKSYEIKRRDFKYFSDSIIFKLFRENAPVVN